MPELNLWKFSQVSVKNTSGGTVIICWSAVPEADDQVTLLFNGTTTIVTGWQGQGSLYWACKGAAGLTWPYFHVWNGPTDQGLILPPSAPGKKPTWKMGPGVLSQNRSPAQARMCAGASADPAILTFEPTHEHDVTDPEVRARFEKLGTGLI